MEKEKDINNQQGYFTDAQFEVLKHNEGNLLVSASAGSGKTSILIEKIVRLIMSGGTKLKRLLVVTFTNNASLEIKQRLQKALSESNNEKLFQELDDLSTSDIMTFDGFCVKLVREFGYSIGRNSNFSVADEALSSFLKNQALDNIFENFDDKFIGFVGNFFEARNEKELRNNIVGLYDFLRSKENSSVYPSQLENLFSFDASNKAFQYIGKSFLVLKGNIIEQLSKLQLEAEMLGDEKLASNILTEKDKLAVIKGDFLADFAYLKGDIKFSSPTCNNKKDSLEIIEIKKQCQQAIKTFKENVNEIFTKEIRSLTDSEIKNDLEKTKKSLLAVFEIVDIFDKEYTRLKNLRQVLDFNDIERLASQILQDKQITTAVQNRYDWIFIDEYQDTSNLQEGIVKKITTGENLLMVGDFKQSIYRFRQAEPTIFINKYNEYKENKSSNLNSVIELKTNFRSENGILQFNNFVFDKIYKKSLDDFEYQGNADLEFGGKIQKVANEPNVKILLIDSKNDTDDESDVDDIENPNNVESNEQTKKIYSVKDDKLVLKQENNLKKQALLLAHEIKEIVGKSYYDAKSQTVKQIEYRDIAVLSRNKNGVILEVKEILNQANIPVTAQYDENIFDGYDIQILMGVLSAINNPKDDMALLTTLANIGNLTFEELATIRENRSKEYFYEEVERYIQENNDTISQKIKICFEKLERYRKESYNKNICELINSIVQNENLDTYFEVNNCENFSKHLSILLSSVQSIKDYSLSEFMNYINTFAGNMQSETTIKDSENAVNLVNIHKSKGLEYPVVFLITTEKRFSNQNLKEKILKDNDWGISMSCFDNEKHITYENIIKNIFKQKIKDEDRKEEKRLLYVALTRPKNFLTIIGTTDCEKLSSNKTDFDINQANSYLKWIMGCFSSDTLNALKRDREAEVLVQGNEKISLRITDESDFDLTKKFKDKTLPQKLEIDKQNFIDILSQKYYHNSLSKKNSVTQIMQEEEHYNITDFSCKKNDKANEDDFLDVGTAYHKIMELIDFFMDDNEIKNQIQKLMNDGKLKDELTIVDLDKIKTAVNQINALIDENTIVLKEQQFLSYMPAFQLVKTDKENKILVQGVADLILIKNDEIYLIDYKTSRLSNEDLFKQRYQTQLDIYAKSIENFYQKPVTKKMIYSFYLNKLIIIV